MQYPEEYYTVLVILMEDDLLHTNGTPFCYDTTCPCHEDSLLIAEVAHFVEDGLLTSDEATGLVAGRLL